MHLPAGSGANEIDMYVFVKRTNMSEYYIMTGETVVEGPFETHGEASRRRADLSMSDVGVTYRVEKR